MKSSGLEKLKKNFIVTTTSLALSTTLSTVPASARHGGPEPGLSFAAVGQLQRNKVVKVEALSTNWAQVQLDDGTNGWIKLEFTATVQLTAKG